MADAESIVRRRIARTEARAAECRLHNRSRFHQRRRTAVLNQLHIYGHGSRIYAQGKAVGADIFSLHDIGRRTDIFESAARTACNDALIHHKLAVFYFVFQMKFHGAVQAYLCTLFRLVQNIRQIGIQFFNGVSIAGMERHGNHRTHLGQIHLDHAVIVRCFTGIKLFIICLPSMDFIKFLNHTVRLPDRGQAGGLRSHNVNADAEIGAQRRHTGTYKFHHLIFHISVLEYGANNGKSHVLRAYAFYRSACQVYAHHSGHIDVISLV